MMLAETQLPGIAGVAPSTVVSNTLSPVAIREGRCTVGPVLAGRILDEAHYDGQRPIAKHHVLLLAEDMRRDRWTAGSQLAFGRLDGRLYLINGRHRMSAVVASGRSIEFQVLILDVETEEELAALYYRFDRRQRARSDSEVLNALKVSETYGLSKRMTKTVFEAALVIASRFRRPNYQADPVGVRSDDARLATAAPWWAVGAAYEQMIEAAPKRLKAALMTAQIGAVGLVTCRYQPTVALEFWRGLALNDGLRRGDARHTLLLDLADRPLDGANLPGAIVAANAWNHFFQRRDVRHLKVMEASSVRLIGTPFDGKKA